MVSLQRTIRLGATGTLMMALAFGAGCSTEHSTVGESPSASAVTPPNSAAAPATETQPTSPLPPTTTAKRLDAVVGRWLRRNRPGDDRRSGQGQREDRRDQWPRR